MKDTINTILNLLKEDKITQESAAQILETLLQPTKVVHTYTPWTYISPYTPTYTYTTATTGTAGVGAATVTASSN